MELDSDRARELEPGSCRGFPIGCGVNIFRASATPNFWLLGVALRIKCGAKKFRCDKNFR